MTITNINAAATIQCHRYHLLSFAASVIAAIAAVGSNRLRCCFKDLMAM
jgi:hypothetical protein